MFLIITEIYLLLFRTHVKLSKITPKVTRKTIGGIYELSRSYWQV